MLPGLIRKLSNHAPNWLLKLLANIWPPFRGAGIKVLYFTKDRRELKVMLKNSFFTKNYVGTQFGGSIFAMTDPFYMLIIIEYLGRDYIVWDKSATIDFKRPGQSALYATFSIADEVLRDIKKNADENEKYLVTLPIDVLDESEKVVARVHKTLYIRKKDKARTRDTKD